MKHTPLKPGTTGLTRKAPLKPGTKRLKSGRSTGTPTKAEAARIVESKLGPCMACEIWHRLFDRRCDAEGCDYNHCKSGNIRRGHLAGYALCAYHHRAVPLDGHTSATMRLNFGPSLMDGSRLFRDTYGSDQELIDLQTDIIQRGNA